jgi:excisionase family DNA binding protein
MTPSQPLTLTVEQAAEVLGVGRSTAYELVRSGDLNCIRLRRRIVVPVAHLAESLGVDSAAVWATLAGASCYSGSTAAATPSSKATSRPSPSTSPEAPTLF